MKVIERNTVCDTTLEHVVASKLTDQQALSVVQALNSCPPVGKYPVNYLAVADDYEGDLIKLLVTVRVKDGCVQHVELDDPAVDAEVPFDLDIRDADVEEDELDDLLDQEDYLADEGADEPQTTDHDNA